MPWIVLGLLEKGSARRSPSTWVDGGFVFRVTCFVFCLAGGVYLLWGRRAVSLNNNIMESVDGT